MCIYAYIYIYIHMCPQVHGPGDRGPQGVLGLLRRRLGHGGAPAIGYESMRLYSGGKTCLTLLVKGRFSSNVANMFANYDDP